MTDLTEAPQEYRTELHYVQVAGLLLAGGVQARVIHGGAFTGIEVRQDAQRIAWGNSTEVWGWTSVDSDSGSVHVGRSLICASASPEDVALAIATAYDRPEDGPSL